MEEPVCSKVTIPLLTYEMLEFELHYLRDLVTGLWLEDVVRGRKAKSARTTYKAALQRALEDPEYRRRAGGRYSSIGLIDSPN